MTDSKIMLHNGKPNEDSGIPQGVGDDDGGKSLWEEAVEKSPKCACYKGCHDEHEVTGGEVDGGVECGSNDETFGEAVALGKAFLYKAAPKDFLCRAYDE